MPQEILDMVIDAVAGSERYKSSLSACSLVCRLWTPRTRHHLFRNVTLSSLGPNVSPIEILMNERDGIDTNESTNEDEDSEVSRLAIFASMLRSAYCTFGPHIRSMLIFRTRNCRNDLHYDAMGKDLKRRCPNIKELRLDGLFSASKPYDGLMCGFPNVTHFSIGFHLSGKSNSTLGMIHSLPSLRRLLVRPQIATPLVFCGLHGQGPPYSPHELLPPRHLHDIETGRENTAHLFSWLRTFKWLEKIDTLKLSPGPADHSQYVVECMNLMGPTLRHLKLDREVTLSGRPTRYTSLLHVVDLSKLTNLQTLTLADIHVSHQNPETYVKYLEFLLRISVPSKLETLVIECPACAVEQLDLINWAAIDKFFANGTHFPKLRSVAVQLRGASSKEYFEKKLPLLCDWDLLGFP
ncbi:hypothetical protein R3P38DRAFT_3344172 [Favolaschia claudopus]|uniref:F-box domain-containing protein n=1 Tax=Favolaschia claudopus TaxID=2862362 RepID=A0AAW0DMK9_9AGAR